MRVHLRLCTGSAPMHVKCGNKDGRVAAAKSFLNPRALQLILFTRVLRSNNCVWVQEVLLGLLDALHALVIALCPPPFLLPLPSFLFLLYFLLGL